MSQLRIVTELRRRREIGCCDDGMKVWFAFMGGVLVY